MMRIPAIIGLMSATLVFLSTGEQHSERQRDRAYSAAAAQRAATIKFAKARNAEIRASLTAVEARQLVEFTQARNAEISSSLAAVEKERNLVAFAAARGAEISEVLAAVKTRRLEEFAEARNHEIAASLAAVHAERNLAAFVAARNEEIAASIAAVETTRMIAFVEARNAEIAASLAAVEAERELTQFAEARNAEIEMSIAAVENVRMVEFAAARNAEIKTAMMAYELQRTGTLALAKRRVEALSIETGSIEAKAGFTAKGILPGGAQTLGGQACQSMIQDVGPIYWTRSTTQLDGASRKRLDALAAIAGRCSSMVIEIHGHSDASGTPATNRRLSERRALAIADYLIAAGVEARRLITIGHGAEAPIVGGDQPESMACNRRIEFTVRDTSGGHSLSQILESLR
jgi:outer membrane protein OmpA-like peptidoglycan-associated protein